MTDLEILIAIIKNGDCIGLGLRCTVEGPFHTTPCPMFHDRTYKNIRGCILSSRTRALELLKDYPEEIIFEVLL